MNFDPERVLALVKIFDFPRAVNTLGEQRAADLIAEEFQRAGLQVERRTIRDNLFLLPLSGAVLVLCTWFGIAAVFPDASLAFRLMAWVIGMMGLVAAFWVQLLLDRVLPSISTEQVIGGWPCDSPPTARVVVFTRHATIPSRSILIGKIVLGYLGAIFWIVLLIPSEFKVEFWPPAVAIPLMLGWWILTLLMLGLPENLGAKQRSRRYRTGLAVLAELARSWPRAHADRIEVRFVATGGIWAGPARLGTFVRRDAATRPTLVLNLDAPGLGSRLVFVGSKPGLALANEAAKGLWLPYRVSRRRWESPLIGTFTGSGLAYVSVRGDRRSAPIDPAALNATAQLVMEMALRWAKQSRKARDIHPLD